MFLRHLNHEKASNTVYVLVRGVATNWSLATVDCFSESSHCFNLNLTSNKNILTKMQEIRVGTFIEKVWKQDFEDCNNSSVMLPPY